VTGDAFGRSVLETLLRGVLIEGMEQKAAKAPPGLVRSSHEVPVQDDFVKEALGQILGPFVVVALAS